MSPYLLCDSPTEPRIGILSEWTQLRMGLNPEWPQPRMDSTPNGLDPNGPNPEGTQPWRDSTPNSGLSLSRFSQSRFSRSRFSRWINPFWLYREDLQYFYSISQKGLNTRWTARASGRISNHAPISHVFVRLLGYNRTPWLSRPPVGLPGYSETPYFTRIPWF